MTAQSRARHSHVASSLEADCCHVGDVARVQCRAGGSVPTKVVRRVTSGGGGRQISVRTDFAGFSDRPDDQPTPSLLAAMKDQKTIVEAHAAELQ